MTYNVFGVTLNLAQ